MRYAELHCMSNFSFLEAASHPEELVGRAAQLGYEALAITDRASLAGIVRAHASAKDAGLKLVIGACVEPRDGVPLVLWAADRGGYGNLCRLLTLGHAAAAEAGLDVVTDSLSGGPASAADRCRCRLSVDDVANHAGGLLAGVPLTRLVRPLAACGFDQAAATAAVVRWKERLNGRLYGLAEAALEGDDESRLARCGAVARAAGVPLAAAGDVRYHVRARMPLFDALTAVRHGSTIEAIRDRLLANGERHLQERRRIVERFATLPGAVERTTEIADRCQFSLDELRYEYPDAVVPAGRTPGEHLAHLTWKGAAQRYPDGVPQKVIELLEHELSLVAELGYEAYFLTVFDLVRFARRRGILCQGRGSAANSAICYCLGITSVDPARMGVLFERFVSRERQEAPDIDIDFEHQRREEVIQYLYDTYGRGRAAMTAEVICYRLRSAVRDLSKVLGLSLDRVDRLISVLDVGDGSGDEPTVRLPERLRQAGLDPMGDTCVRLVALTRELVGFPRHLGQHVGGMVMTRGDLCDIVPIQPATMAGRTVIQWNKDDLDELGILKVDCLALGMLSAIHRAFDLVAAAGGPALTLATVPTEDPSVYEMISRADTVGVFQIESRAQMSMLPRLRPACFYDLVIEVAIVRPGPIQGDMVHPYLRRRLGEELPAYPNEAIREVLEKTLGVPLFQEQAMRLAVVAAGFTAGEADHLRRAMGAWRRPGVIDEFRRRLLEGMLARGLSQAFAEQVFQQIRGFGEYGFPESHAASFALLVYVSAWLKRHHPAAFTAALLGSQPMGFYAPAQLVRDARAHGVTVLPACVHASDWHATLELVGTPEAEEKSSPAIRLGLEQVYGLGEAAGKRIEQARAKRPFADLDDLTSRANLDREELLHLARAGALAGFGFDRRQAVWEALEERHDVRRMPLFEGTAKACCPALEQTLLPAADPLEEIVSDYRTAGLSLRGHPLTFGRRTLTARGTVTAADVSRLPEGRRVMVAGIVLGKQRPATAAGVIFLTLEDETATTNVVVRPDVWEQSDHEARRAAVLLVAGRVQRRGSIVHLLATRLEGVALDGEPLGAARHTAVSLPRMSRDFH
jgi:error-prone DNA polymerase